MRSTIFTKVTVLVQVCFDLSVSAVPKAFDTKTGSGHI